MGRFHLSQEIVSYKFALICIRVSTVISLEKTKVGVNHFYFPD